ncbi:LacI family DNA-binding transcriptional regulator [Microaceticoccus formicicus]|uniref:LacI family DNA-binding transcriptional regulator n=1 Tax=Microaceticoccus formicicus TaxID=3118105 RepID=UPI003CD0066C|nr:LacI family DNA-binding transcriptional regulator [Peptoniphilaceae bacterium AMB_02]
MAITIKDVAREAGVSITTVSMVLNESDYPISDKTKNKVFETAKRLNYVPNRIARNLVMRQSNSIALIVPDITNPFYPEIAKAVSEVAESRGFNLFLINTNNETTKNSSWLEVLENGLIEGALIISRESTITDAYKRSRNIKIVYLDEPGFSEDKDAYIVTGDSKEGGYIAGKHLISLGHKKLACIAGPEETPNSSRRLSGFLKACMENDIYLDTKYILFGNYSFDGGYECGKVLANEDITGIFAFNDLSAYGAIRALKEGGKSLLKDYSIIGYDNLLMTAFTDPSLTTIDQFSKQIGISATNILLDLIKGRKVNERKVLVKPKLVLRETTGKIG